MASNSPDRPLGQEFNKDLENLNRSFRSQFNISIIRRMRFDNIKSSAQHLARTVIDKHTELRELATTRGRVFEDEWRAKTPEQRSYLLKKACPDMPKKYNSIDLAMVDASRIVHEEGDKTRYAPQLNLDALIADDGDDCVFTSFVYARAHHEPWEFVQNELVNAQFDGSEMDVEGTKDHQKYRMRFFECTTAAEYGAFIPLHEADETKDERVTHGHFVLSLQAFLYSALVYAVKTTVEHIDIDKAQSTDTRIRAPTGVDRFDPLTTLPAKAQYGPPASFDYDAVEALIDSLATRSLDKLFDFRSPEHFLKETQYMSNYIIPAVRAMHDDKLPSDSRPLCIEYNLVTGYTDGMLWSACRSKIRLLATANHSKTLTVEGELTSECKVAFTDLQCLLEDHMVVLLDRLKRDAARLPLMETGFELTNAGQKKNKRGEPLAVSLADIKLEEAKCPIDRLRAYNAIQLLISSLEKKSQGIFIVLTAVNNFIVTDSEGSEWFQPHIVSTLTQITAVAQLLRQLQTMWWHKQWQHTKGATGEVGTGSGIAVVLRKRGQVMSNVIKNFCSEVSRIPDAKDLAFPPASYDPAMIRGRAAAETKLRDYLQPVDGRLGHTSVEVGGDEIRFSVQPGQSSDDREQEKLLLEQPFLALYDQSKWWNTQAQDIVQRWDKMKDAKTEVVSEKTTAVLFQTPDRLAISKSIGQKPQGGALVGKGESSKTESKLVKKKTHGQADPNHPAAAAHDVQHGDEPAAFDEVKFQLDAKAYEIVDIGMGRQRAGEVKVDGLQHFLRSCGFVARQNLGTSYTVIPTHPELRKCGCDYLHISHKPGEPKNHLRIDVFRKFWARLRNRYGFEDETFELV